MSNSGRSGQLYRSAQCCPELRSHRDVYAFALAELLPKPDRFSASSSRIPQRSPSSASAGSRDVIKGSQEGFGVFGEALIEANAR